MSYLKDIEIVMNLSAKPLSRAGFSVPLILGVKAAEHPAVGTYRLVSELTDLTGAGYATTDAEYKMAAKMLGQSPKLSQIAVYTRPLTQTITEALAALSLSHNDWYLLLIEERSNAALAEAGDAALGMKKFFIGCATDVSALAGRNNMREAYLIHTDAAAFPEAAWVGQCMPKDIGTLTWKWKSPSGITEAAFNITQLQAIRDANGQSAAKYAGIIYIDEGKCTSGDFIDAVHTIDYIEARLQEDLFFLNITNDKVPFDPRGFAQVDATLRTRLMQAATQGIIARVGSDADLAESDDGTYMFKVSVPQRADIPAADRTARILEGTTFSFILSGAIHKYRVNGRISA